MTPEQLIDALARGERRSMEFKCAGSFNDPDLLAKVARAILAMANNRDGGTVIIGVDDNDPATSGGLDQQQYAEWSNHDLLADKLAKYAEPSVTFECRPVHLSDGRKFVAIEVAEFADTPVFAAKAYQSPGSNKETITKGALYVRASSGRPASIAVPDSHHHRELIDIAVEKQVRRFTRLQHLAGGTIGSFMTSAPDAYDTELGDLAATVDLSSVGAINSNIRDHGYIWTRIRPVSHKADRFQLNELKDIVLRSSVRLRGWDMPHFDNHEDVAIHDGYIEQSSAWEDCLEVWRMHRDGQFANITALNEDWVSDAIRKSWLEGHTKALSIGNTLYALAERFELADRLAQRWPDSGTVVEIAIHGLAGRTLVSGESRRMPLWRNHTTQASSWQRSWTLSHLEITGNARDLAIDAATDFFQLFGWLPERQLLSDQLAELRWPS